MPYYTNHRTINTGPGFNLNNCHSYFLLVDDGTVGKYGCEISFRRRFERFLSRHKSEIFMDFDLSMQKTNNNLIKFVLANVILIYQGPKKCDVTIEEKSKNILGRFVQNKIYR